MRNIDVLLVQLDSLYESGDRAAMEAFFNRHIPEAEKEGDYGVLLTLYNEYQGLLRTGGRAPEAAEVTKKALALIEELGLKGTKNHAVTLINAGTAHSMAGKAEEALGYFHEAEELLTDLGEGGATLASLYNNMSHVLNRLRRPEEALSALEKALVLIRTVPGEEGAVAVSELGISSTLMSLGRFADSEKYIKSALVYFESEAGSRDPHRCSAYSTAAELMYRKGDYEESVRLYEKALSLLRAVYGDNDACRITEKNLAMAREKAEKR